MPTRSEIESLIYLLDDPDEFIQQSVVDRFNALGERSVPLLDQLRIETRAPGRRKLIDELILKLTFPTIEMEFLNFTEGGIDSLAALESGVFLLARIDNPTIRAEHYVRMLDRMALEIQAEVNYSAEPLQQMKIATAHVFGHHKLMPASENYFDVRHAHIHTVLEGKTGIPLTLALIMLFVANRLDLPFHGVNMPIHFLIRFDVMDQVVYLDPFNGGLPISMNDCLDFLKKNNIRPEQEYFAAATPLQMFARAMRNLVNSYSRQKDELRSACVSVLLTHLDNLYSDRA